MMRLDHGLLIVVSILCVLFGVVGSMDEYRP